MAAGPNAPSPLSVRHGVVGIATLWRTSNELRMIKGLTREVTLAIQARSGASSAVLVCAVVAVVASLTAFVFLCVAAYDWLMLNFGGVVAGLVMAAIFVAIAATVAGLSALTRRRVKRRAVLERAARAPLSSWLLDPKIVATGVQVGRSLGWQRIASIVVLGFIAAQLARGHRERGAESTHTSFR